MRRRLPSMPPAAVVPHVIGDEFVCRLRGEAAKEARPPRQHGRLPRAASRLHQRLEVRKPLAGPLKPLSHGRSEMPVHCGAKPLGYLEAVFQQTRLSQAFSIRRLRLKSAGSVHVGVHILPRSSATTPISSGSPSWGRLSLRMCAWTRGFIAALAAAARRSSATTTCPLQPGAGVRAPSREGYGLLSSLWSALAGPGETLPGSTEGCRQLRGEARPGATSW
jgi:hypothetical protein